MAADSGSPFDLDTARELLRAAGQARANAYAPYSRLEIGAALLSGDGRIFTGVNVENASFGLTLCAERTAVVKAVSEGVRELRAIAIAGPDDDVAMPPCGACRQVLYELGPEMLVITSSGSNVPHITPIKELLPGAFDSRRLPERAKD